MIALTDQEFQVISGYVRSNYGIDLSKKRFLIESRLWIELAKVKADNYTEYWNLLTADKTGKMKQKMIDLLTTNYTYFDREKEHFRFLTEHLIQNIPEGSQKPFSIWCAGCATGQECYTLAMYLSDCVAKGELRHPFQILGTDLSEKAIADAEKATYNSADYARLSKHWQASYCSDFSGGQFQIKPLIRNKVSFRKHNLLKPLGSTEQFPVIFCRNVMIYFREEERKRLVEGLIQSLQPGGYLFISQTETLQGLNVLLEYIQPAVYRKPGDFFVNEKKNTGTNNRRFQTISEISGKSNFSR